MEHHIYGVVYRITCIVSGKQYHGQSIHPEQRWHDHFRKDSRCWALHNAINKYGRSSFVFEILAYASTKEELDTLEKQWVLTSMSPIGYNLKEGGANGSPSEETRRKMSLSQKEAQSRPEVKARVSAGLRRAYASPEMRERLRKTQKEVQNRPEVRENKRRAMVEIHARPEMKERYSRALRDSWAAYSEEDREQRVLTAKAACTTEEHRANMSRISKESLSRPEVKEKLRAGQAASWTPERRVAHGEKMEEVHARPGQKEKRGKSLRDVWASYSEEERERRKLAMREGCATQECRDRRVQIMKEVRARPELKEKFRQAALAAWTPERKEVISAKMKEIHSRPGDKEKRASAISQAFSTPEGKRKLRLRRRRNESLESWQARIVLIQEEDARKS